MDSKTDWWESHLAAWRDSGLNQVTYCRQHELSLACFGYWRGKLRSALRPLAPSAQALLPIVVSEVTRSDDCIDVTLANGLQARLPVDMNTARWVPMIRALMAC